MKMKTTVATQGHTVASLEQVSSCNMIPCSGRPPIQDMLCSIFAFTQRPLLFLDSFDARLSFLQVFRCYFCHRFRHHIACFSLGGPQIVVQGICFVHLKVYAMISVYSDVVEEHIIIRSWKYPQK